MPDNCDFCEICRFRKDYVDIVTEEDGRETLHKITCGSGRYPHPCPGFAPAKTNA